MERTSYQLSYPTGFEPPVLSVITTRTFQAKGPLAFFTEDGYGPHGRAAWRMDLGFSPSPHEPVCYTVEEMLEKGWIEEVDE